MRENLTTLIIARNGEQTIARAVKSIVDCGSDWPILLVDDFSSDQTVAIARDIGGAQLRVVRPDQHIGTGNARQTALEHIKTDYGVWLDADDAIKPQRNATVLKTLVDEKADMVIHGVDLKDGVSGQLIKPLPIPDFLLQDHSLFWQLERNWLPFLGPAFRVDASLDIGYNRALTACEDYDHFQGCLLAGHGITRLPDLLLDHYAYAGSVSRQIDQHKQQLKSVYRSIPAATIQSFLDHSGLSTLETGWIGMMRRIYAQAYDAALEDCMKLQALGGETTKICIPYNRPYMPLVLLIQATVMLVSAKRADSKKAVSLLKMALEYDENQADCLNNLGCAFACSGDSEGAIEAFEKALQLVPAYHDASENLKLVKDSSISRQITLNHLHVTLSPLRHYATRSDY